MGGDIFAINPLDQMNVKLPMQIIANLEVGNLSSDYSW